MQNEPLKRLPRTLDDVEKRVLGTLLEKEQATPDYYPMTLNSLVAACNQKSNRHPVMALDSADVQDALDRMLPDVLVWRSDGSRVRRWRHSLDRRWQLDPASKAIMTLLLLRGPQTPGELRSRSDRLHGFDSVGQVLDTLRELASGREPLVRELPRQPGQKETRWYDLVGDSDPVEEMAASTTRAAPATRSTAGGSDRVARLEERVERLERRLESLLRELDPNGVTEAESA